MRTCKQMLLEFLNANKGWHNKAKFSSELKWYYDDGSGRTYSSDTINPKLRELEREGKVQRREIGGQTEYSRLGVPNTRIITRHRIVNGIAIPYLEEVNV